MKHRAAVGTTQHLTADELDRLLASYPGTEPEVIAGYAVATIDGVRHVAQIPLELVAA